MSTQKVTTNSDTTITEAGSEQSLRPDARHNESLKTITSDIPKRHRLIEVLISRHEETIERYMRMCASTYPQICPDSIESRFYLKLTQTCLNQDGLLSLQDANLNPQDPTQEAKIISRLLKHARIDEYRRWKKHAFHSQTFSQLREFNPNQIAGAHTTHSVPTEPISPAVRLADNLHRLGIELTDRQFTILLCRVQSATHNTPTPYADIAHDLKISPKTVQREITAIINKAYTAKYGTLPTEAPATQLKREQFRKLLEDMSDLPTDISKYLETYIELTSDNKRPTQDALCKELGITINQLKNRQRRAKALIPGLLG